MLGFGRWDAARAQLGTASVGLAGALTALGANGTEGMADGRFTSWILPFTAGGFLHIALVTGIDVTPLSLLEVKGTITDQDTFTLCKKFKPHYSTFMLLNITLIGTDFPHSPASPHVVPNFG